MMANPEHTQLRLQLLARCRLPDGLRASEFNGAGYAKNSVLAQLIRLCSEGVIFRSKVSHKVVRFFGTQAEAAVHEAKHRRSIDRTVTTAHRSRAPWSDSDPAIITADTKVTIATTPPRALRTNTHSGGAA